MVVQDHLWLRAAVGVEGDVNAGELSPRQILLANVCTYQAHSLPPGALRENILLSDSTVERLPSGSLVRLGESIIRITYSCPPCHKLNEEEAGLLRRIGVDRGILARVIVSGNVLIGDQVEILPDNMSVIPESPRQRAYRVIRSVPVGSAVTYAHIQRCAGMTKGFVRVIPRFLKTAPPRVPVHRVVASGGSLIQEHIRDQRALLLGEGAHVNRWGSVMPESIWVGNPYSLEESCWRDLNG